MNHITDEDILKYMQSQLDIDKKLQTYVEALATRVDQLEQQVKELKKEIQS